MSIKLNLFGKSEEIYNALPKKYAEMILNSIIAQSLSNGSLIKEASIFLSSEDLKKISEKLSFKVEMKKNSLEKKKYKANINNISLSKKEEQYKKDISVFDGFD